MDSEDRQRAESRLEIVAGLLAALDSWPDVSQVVWQSADRRAAHAALRQRFDWPEHVTHYLLDMPLGRIHTLARADLAEEAAELRRLLST
ncbi:MAG: hypothetical protein ACRBK7_08330 [Acidimicrobiales bacterium]